jgi:hypothetical protein
MSNYTKATNFTQKDGLSSGDPNKIIKGSEIDVEYSAIASAVNSKADSDSPTFTGTPAAPTATAGTNSTQIASTAFVTTAITAQGLGTIATQDSDSVAVTGGTASGLTITSSTVEGHTVGSNATGTKTVSTASPSGGSDGDVWYKVA